MQNKKGKSPSHTAIIAGIECEVMISGSRHKDIYFMPKKEEDFGKIEAYLKNAKTSEILIPITLPTDEKILSRFLAKVALEVLTHRIYKIDGWEEQVIDFEPLDEIREYARYGKGPELWPFYERSIYDENHHASDGGQTMHEFDLLYTEQQELYAVICIFGTEYTINLGGPDLDGYEKWLEEHSFESPLYHGKNAKYLERLE